VQQNPISDVLLRTLLEVSNILPDSTFTVRSFQINQSIKLNSVSNQSNIPKKILYQIGIKTLLIDASIEQ